MQIVFNPARIGTCALAIGNFDGVHLGHRQILAKAAEVAKEIDQKLAVMTFEPHPRMFFQREKAPKRITLFKQKMQLLQDAGVQTCNVMKFNSAFAGISAEDFMSRFLRRANVITGENFGFGTKRGGDSALLKENLGSRYHPVGVMGEGEEVISSSRIRTLLKDGEVTQANALLGYEFFIEGIVQSGEQNGRKIGFPTANIALRPKQIRPKYGVYAVQTNFGNGVANFGVRPSVDGKTELLEVHIFDFNQDIYGKHLHVKFHDYIRVEKVFAGFDELAAQIERDRDAAKKFFE